MNLGRDLRRQARACCSSSLFASLDTLAENLGRVVARNPGDEHESIYVGDGGAGLAGAGGGNREGLRPEGKRLRKLKAESSLTGRAGRRRWVLKQKLPKDGIEDDK